MTFRRRSMWFAPTSKFTPDAPSVPDNRLFVFCYLSGSDASGEGVSENRLMELREDGSIDGPVRVALAHPMTSFFTATWRAGSPPSNVLDLLGTRVDGGGKISYARIRLCGQ